MISAPQSPTKFSSFIEREMEILFPIAKDRQYILSLYALQLIADKFSSLSRTAQASNGDFNDKNIRQALKDLLFCKEIIDRERAYLFKTFDKRKNVYLGTDDMTVSKTGKRISFTQVLFDHTSKSFVNGWLIFDTSIKYNGKIYGASYMIKPPQVKEKFFKHKNGENDQVRDKISTILVETMLTELIMELLEAGFSKAHIIVLVDRWYPSEHFFTFLRKVGVKFVVAVKKNSKVLLPDKAKFERSKIRKRGKKPVHFLRNLPVEKYFNKYGKSHWFTLPDHSELSETKSATLNLSIVKQVKVFAVIFPGQTSWRYFVAPKIYSSVFQMYNHYSKRWAVETVHEVLKGVLGLDKGKMRLEPLVKAHILLVYLIHFLFLKYQRYLETEHGFTFTPRQLYDHVRTSIPLIPDPLKTQFQAILSEVTN
jgi:hypothetical protein